MKIQPAEIFHTPDDFQYVLDWIEGHAPEERPHLITAAMMTWNYLAKKVNEEGESK